MKNKEPQRNKKRRKVLKKEKEKKFNRKKKKIGVEEGGRGKGEDRRGNREGGRVKIDRESRGSNAGMAQKE